MSGPDYASLPSEWFRRCGKSGLKLPSISLGLWQNFGSPGTAAHGADDEETFHAHARTLIWTAFDHGITHFDFANNYGPPPGAAEERCGRIFAEMPREEMLIATKAGYGMWNGPYGNGGSRKYLMNSCDQSLKRLRMDYVDIFYHHRPDPETPLEETFAALDHIVRSGRALYVGISNYPAELATEAMRVCESNNFTKPILHQPRYNMIDRHHEPDLFQAAADEGFGMIAFSPLEQGMLTDKYLKEIPEDSRANAPSGGFTVDRVKTYKMDLIAQLNDLAKARGQSLAQLAIQWVLRVPEMTSALIGASRPEQITDLAAIADFAPISSEELSAIEAILSQGVRELR